MQNSFCIERVPFGRDLIPEYLNQLGLNGLGVEVGVQKGVYTKTILNVSNLRKLYMVDSWRKIQTDYNDIANVGPFAHLQAFMQAFLHVYSFESRAVMVREESTEAAVLFEDGSLDFVYLDADHSYDGVNLDIEAWYPKVKPGGILAGHDYLNSPKKENGCADFGVEAAVNEFAKNINKKVMVTTEADGSHLSWMIQL